MYAYRCARTGLYFPSDYVEQWGRKYGHGLGPTPVSEALVNDYHFPVVHQKNEGDPVMVPVGVCRAQVDLVEISEEEYNSKRAILQTEDPKMQQRARIMWARQMANSQKVRNANPGMESVAAAIEVPGKPAVSEPVTVEE